MTSYTWILLLLASLVATRAQDFDLADAFDDDAPAKPTEKPAPPKIPDSEPKKPAVVPPKTDDGDLNLLDAFGTDDVTKKPVVPPKERGTGGGSFDDKDLFDLNEGGEYKPDGGRSGGRGGDIPQDNENGGASDQPQGGAMAAIISSVGVAILGAASSYFAYQKKKLCFKVQGGEDPESGKNRGTQSEPQVLSNLLRSS
ncbi:CD99 molecule isoform X1 [Carassius carassius]|uniref:CD99 molecule isoform X1 n=1 Tax=Carassius carassius TaxID=217509 RepID=UPI0028696353|nr:CD99 molecule isoform X1 [Carassius carassius]